MSCLFTRRRSSLSSSYKANDILFASNKRAMEREWRRGEIFAWAWSGLRRVFIGFGYRTHYSIYWVIGFVAFGAWAFRRPNTFRIRTRRLAVAYSLDMLLPLISLREAHDRIDLQGWPHYYFYFHKTMGYVLASFLIAGLSGLTK